MDLAIRPTKGGANAKYINECTMEPDQLLPGMQSWDQVIVSYVRSKVPSRDRQVRLKSQVLNFEFQVLNKT